MSHSSDDQMPGIAPRWRGMPRWFSGCLALLFLLLAACSAPTPRQGESAHLSSTAIPKPVQAERIPAPVQQNLALPRPRAAARSETYSVVVSNVPVQDLLFALARDASLNIDIDPEIRGVVTLNAIDQTLPQLLARIARQIDMRFELEGQHLVVLADKPFLKHYKVDYVNLSRTVTGTVSTNTQIATSSGSAGSSSGGSGSSGGSSGSGGGNISSTRIENASKNQFWTSLEQNIKDLLRDEDRILWERSCQDEQNAQSEVTGAAGVASSSLGGGPPNSNLANIMSSALGSLGLSGKGEQNVSGQSKTTQNGQKSAQHACGQFKEAVTVIVNPETGVVAVRTTARQHERVREFIERVTSSARRQVMIEATIVEVELSDGYQQGIEWSRVRADNSGFKVSPASISSNTGTSVQPFSLSMVDNKNPLNLSALLNMLQSFGTTKVLSSPRLSVLNNQTAVLKVVDNFVYFNVSGSTAVGSTTTPTTTTVTTTAQSVSVGLVMSVTAQISETETVILNVRPTISSITDLKEDPNPNIPAGIKNYVPQIRTREIESVMRVTNGEIAVLGGLMQDSIDYRTGRVPGLGNIPILGELLTTRANAARKSELVIFLRPVVVRDGNGDYRDMQRYLPGPDFFQSTPTAEVFNNLPSRSTGEILP